MGLSKDYSHVPDWVEKPQGYQTGEMVKYESNVFIANFWASKPGEGEANDNGWRLYDELYDVTSSPATEPAKIIGYIPTWRKKEGFDYANAEMYRHITHGIISFLMFSETEIGEFERKSVDDVDAIVSDVVLTGHDCGTYISIALGGAVDYGFFDLMERIGNNPGDPVLQKAVKNVVDFVKTNGLDGVDLDLECWWDKNSDANKDRGGKLKSDGAHPAGKGLTEFAKQLKKAMPDKIISAALFATSWYGNCYDPGLVEYVDWLGIMTYDLTGSWDQSPVGPQTALLKIREQKAYAEEQQGEWPGNRKSSANATEPMSDNLILSVEDSLWYWTNPFFTNWQGKGQNLKRNKIAVGVPIYGYDFAYGKEPDDLSGQVAPGYKSIRYKDILSQFPDAPTAANANIKVPGNTPRPPFVSAAGTYPYAHNIYFETPKTATDKLKFLKSVGAQGVIIWELSNDVWEGGKSVIQALYQNSGNPAEKEKHPALGHHLNLAAVTNRSDWIEVKGENSYCYCVCNRAGKQKESSHAMKHTMKIDAGAPYFYAVLTKPDGSTDFPTGARLTIEGPDGTKYDRDIQEENQLVIMYGSSVRCLIVKDPKPGDWKMTMNVQHGVGFHCECNTVPSKDVYDTIINTLNAPKVKISLQPRFVVSLGVLAYLGIASIVGIIGAVYAGESRGPAHRVAFNLAVAGTGNVVLQITNPGHRMGVNEIAETLAANATETSSSQTATPTPTLQPVEAQDALQLYLSTEENRESNGGLGEFEILLQNGTRFKYSSYLEWIAGIRTHNAAGNWLAVRLNINDVQSPWIKLEPSNFYVRAFSQADNPWANGAWRAISPSQINYGNRSINISLRSIENAMRRVDNWTRSQGTESVEDGPLTLLIFLSAEAARFDGVAFAVNALLRGQGEENYDWLNFKDLLKDWSFISENIYRLPRGGLQPGVSLFVSRALAGSSRAGINQNLFNYLNQLAVLGYPLGDRPTR